MHISAVKSEWIPARVPSPKWMIVLHGRGDSPEGFHWLPSVIGDPEMSYLLLQAPDEYYTGFSWYDLPPDQGPGILRSRLLLDKVFEETDAQGFRTEDAVLFGFSQGCLMTLEWGGRTKRVFKAFIGISSYCYDPEALVREMSESARHGHWLITHGTFDDVLNFKVTEAQVEFLKSHGLPLDFKRYRKAHTIDEREELPMLLDYLRRIYPQT